jgi:2-dehydropantoate 2-reductase
MEILIIGAGVIGTVYGAQLGAAGNAVSVLAHGERTEAVAAAGLLARNVIDGTQAHSSANVIAAATEGTFDLVLVALRRDQLHTAAAPLAAVNGRPLVLFLGNNPAGRKALAAAPDATVSLGFPGVGGTMADDVASYLTISQQPTALETSDDPRLAGVAGALQDRGFAIQRVAEMDGWLAFHAVFVACVSAALYSCQTDPSRLASNRSELRLMCQAITEGFRALRAQDLRGLPRNLALLHHRFLTRIAISYWAHAMRTPVGELAFAAHARHAEGEMRALGRDVLLRLPSSEATKSLRGLLAPTES